MAGGVVVKSAPHRRRGGGFGGFLKLLAILILLAGVVGVGGYFYARNVYTAAGPATPDGKPRYVMIDPGSGSAAIAKRLREAGAINDETQFKLAVKAADVLWKPAPPPAAPGAPAKKAEAKLVMKTGEFAIPSGASLEQVITELAYGKRVQYTVIVPEGLTSAQIVNLLNRSQWAQWKPPGQPADPTPRTLQLAEPADDIPGEGTLLPGDYQVRRGETVTDVLKRMSKAQDDLLAQLWDKRKPDLPFTTQREAVNLASIVEKETGLAEERPLVAAAFVTRLKTGVRLQSDATVIYALDRGERQGTALTAEENRTVSPYNTYQNDGLPPTPICNPGKDAIAAVLNPPDSKAIYFVADGVTGGHKFAETLAEHEKNVASLARLRAGERAAANAQKKLDAGMAAKTPAAPATPASPAAHATSTPAAKPTVAAPTPASAASPKPALKPATPKPTTSPATDAPTPAAKASPAAPPGAP